MEPRDVSTPKAKPASKVYTVLFPSSIFLKSGQGGDWLYPGSVDRAWAKGWCILCVQLRTVKLQDRAEVWEEKEGRLYGPRGRLWNLRTSRFLDLTLASRSLWKCICQSIPKVGENIFQLYFKLAWFKTYKYLDLRYTVFHLYTCPGLANVHLYKC